METLVSIIQSSTNTSTNCKPIHIFNVHVVTGLFYWTVFYCTEEAAGEAAFSYYAQHAGLLLFSPLLNQD